MNSSRYIHVLITLSFVACLVPAVLLLIVYGLRSRWEQSAEGRAFMRLFAITVVGFALSVVVTAEPHWFHGAGFGNWVRIIVRFAIAGVLWDLLRLILRAQRTTTGKDQK